VAETHLRFLSRVATKGRLVDVGCSTGLFLQRAAAAGFEPTGIEYSQESADVAYALTGLEVEHGSIHNTMLEPECADVVTMFDVIEHVPDPASDLAAAWRMLKPGGWLVLSTPNIDGLFPRASYPLANKLDYWAHPEPPYHLYQFSVRTLGEMLAKAGFEPGAVEHHAIDLAYTFGSLDTLRHSPKRALYALLFAPLAKLGPLINMGDWFYIAARKPHDAKPVDITPPVLRRAA
jgi:SAM-dependent methyltransferase